MTDNRMTRDQLFDGFSGGSKSGADDWVHRIIRDACIICYYNGQTVASGTGDWDRIEITARIPMSMASISFSRTDVGRRAFFATLDIIENAYESGKYAKAEEFRKCIGVKESR